MGAALPLLVALSLGQYTPAEAQALFVEANDAYYQGHYDDARARYQKLLDAGLGGPDVLFNLGTTCLAEGDLGHAVLYLERARRIDDEDDVEANLAVARQRQVDQVVGAEAGRPFVQRVAEAIDERVVSVAFLVVWWAAFAAWLVTRRRAVARLWWGLGTAGLVALSLVLASVVGAHAWVQHRVAEAVVIPAAAEAREFPGETAKVAFEVHAGLKVRTMEVSGKYTRIRLPNALEGWVESEGLVDL